MSAASVHVVAATVSTNQVVSSDMQTIVIPSESVAHPASLPALCFCVLPPPPHLISITHIASALPMPAVMAVDADGNACPGTQLPAFTLPQLKSVIFAENNPDGMTLGSQYSSCSYGKTKLTAGTSVVTDFVRLPCSGST